MRATSCAPADQPAHERHRPAAVPEPAGRGPRPADHRPRHRGHERTLIASWSTCHRPTQRRARPGGGARPLIERVAERSASQRPEIEVAVDGSVATGRPQALGGPSPTWSTTRRSSAPTRRSDRDLAGRRSGPVSDAAGHRARRPAPVFDRFYRALDARAGRGPVWDWPSSTMWCIARIGLRRPRRRRHGRLVVPVRQLILTDPNTTGSPNGRAQVEAEDPLISRHRRRWSAPAARASCRFGAAISVVGGRRRSPSRHVTTSSTTSGLVLGHRGDQHLPMTSPRRLHRHHGHHLHPKSTVVDDLHHVLRQQLVEPSSSSDRRRARPTGAERCRPPPVHLTTQQHFPIMGSAGHLVVVGGRGLVRTGIEQLDRLRVALEPLPPEQRDLPPQPGRRLAVLAVGPPACWSRPCSAWEPPAAASTPRSAARRGARLRPLVAAASPRSACRREAVRRSKWCLARPRPGLVQLPRHLARSWGLQGLADIVATG